MAFKLAISAGHYRYTAGKRCMKAIDPNETREWVLNSRIAEKVEKILNEYADCEILRVDDRTGNTDVGLRNRATASDNFNADFYLSIHHNAGINGGSGGGIVVFSYRYAQAVSYEWQKEMYEALIKETGLVGNRCEKMIKSGLYECRVPKAPAILLELGFMDSTTDVPIILSEKFADQCAKAITDVIIKRANLKKKTTYAPTTKPTVEKTEYSLVDFVKDIQKACGAAVDGVAGTETLSKTITVSANTNDRHPVVKAIQKRLVALGYTQVGTVDGVAGSKFTAAVKAFQKDNGCVSDGVITAKNMTWKKLLGITEEKTEVKTEVKKEEKVEEYSLVDFVKDVQKACGAAVDGIAGNETLSKTITVSASKNNSHAVVKAIQKRLFVLGYTEVGTVDGIAGSKFTAAVKAFQKKNGCWADGVVTAKNKTWKKLLGMK